MRIGFDIDDTITRCPQLFSLITKALMASGHDVYIISYREDREFAEDDLREHDVSYSELILPPDQELHRATSEPWKQVAAQWKADVCARLEIDVLFDDMPEVVNALGPGTCAFLAVDSSRGSVEYGSGA